MIMALATKRDRFSEAEEENQILGLFPNPHKPGWISLTCFRGISSHLPWPGVDTVLQPGKMPTGNTSVSYGLQVQVSAVPL